MIRIASLAFALAAAPAGAGPHVLGDAAAPGPDTAPGGVALLERLFPEGLPVPFEAVLERLRAVAGAENVVTALIPLGRSLQRHAAAPDYFASPRIVVAVTGDEAAGPGDPRLADRVFLGYQPASEVIEAISHNGRAGRFEFQEVIGYGRGGPDRPEPAGRTICLTCHQGAAPIFARPLWNESNADAEIAARLAALGETFEGAPVRSSVDALDAFDAATDRAAALALGDLFWAEGCGDGACRAALLVAALRAGLAGDPGGGTDGFEVRVGARWPGGIAVVSPDLPNRDPLMMQDPDAAVEAVGAMNPETPRARVLLWAPGEAAWPVAARALAARFSAGDLGWIEARLALGGGGTRVDLPCSGRMAPIATGGRELRFACAGEGYRLDGFVGEDGAGRIERMTEPGGAALRRAALGDAMRPPRLSDGRRLADLEVDETHAAFVLVNDMTALAARLAARADALAAGPFDRQAALRLIGEVLEQGDG